MTDCAKKSQTSCCGTSVDNKTADMKHTVCFCSRASRVQTHRSSLPMGEVRGKTWRVRHREVKSLVLRHMQPVRGWRGPSPGCLTTEPAGVPALTPLLKTLPLVWPVSADDYHTPGQLKEGTRYDNLISCGLTFSTCFIYVILIFPKELSASEF